MKEFKGTPGKWYNTELEIFSNVAGRTKVGEATDLTEFRSDSLLEVQEANAKLFAASKQMLEALQEFVEWAEFNQSYDKCGQSYYKAKAALSAALD